MNQYEVIYIIDTALEEQARVELISRFSNLVAQNGGKVERVDEWGKRRLAYAINYKTEGYYVLMYVSAPPALPRELERNLQISDAVLRYLVIRFEGQIPAKREPLKPFVPREAVISPVVENAPKAEPEAPASAPEAPASAPETPVSAPETPASAPETPVSAPEAPVSEPDTDSEAPDAEAE